MARTKKGEGKGTLALGKKRAYIVKCLATIPLSLALKGVMCLLLFICFKNIEIATVPRRTHHVQGFSSMSIGTSPSEQSDMALISGEGWTRNEGRQWKPPQNVQLDTSEKIYCRVPDILRCWNKQYLRLFLLRGPFMRWRSEGVPGKTCCALFFFSFCNRGRKTRIAIFVQSFCVVAHLLDRRRHKEKAQYFFFVFNGLDG